jgi:hypothetical protein
MKKTILTILFILLSISISYSQNLILNPSFEKYLGSGCPNIYLQDSMNIQPIPTYCVIQDWIRISESPDVFSYKANDFPKNNYSNYIYPHSDSVCVGGGFFSKLPNTLREIIEGKLTKPLTANHHYQFSMYVQLFDTINSINVGKIVGINSFSALFTDTIIPSHTDLPIQNYTPQVQINTIVTDTQHWVQLIDTFIAEGGEQFVSIGNFKLDSQTQFVLVDSQSNLPEAAYYYIDDVSLIDLDDVGIEEVGKNNNLKIYPNPTQTGQFTLTVQSNEIGKAQLQISNYMGQIILDRNVQLSSNNQWHLDLSKQTSGTYLVTLKTSSGKFGERVMVVK